MEKKLFTESINALKTQTDHDIKCSDAFAVILPDCFIIGYANYHVTQQLIKVLESAMGDKGEWINYFCYELDFGAKYEKGCVTHKNGRPINISTSAKLYDFLKRNNK